MNYHEPMLPSDEARKWLACLAKPLQNFESWPQWLAKGCDEKVAS